MQKQSTPIEYKDFEKLGKPGPVVLFVKPDVKKISHIIGVNSCDLDQEERAALFEGREFEKNAHYSSGYSLSNRLTMISIKF